MARLTVGQIMQNIGATVNQDASQPQDGSADWTLWLQFINRAQIEWAESYDWEELKKWYYPNVALATNASQASIGLPLDFRKVAAPVVNYWIGASNVVGDAWTEILPERKTQMSPIDRYFYIEGDPNGGHYMTWNPGYSASGASIEIPYYYMPTSLTSSTQYPVIPDSEFLVNRTIAYVFEARSDPRFQEQEVKSRERLLQMVENSSLAKYSSYNNPIRIQTPENKSNFRIGRN